MMKRARKTNNLRETPQYDQIYNVTRYDDYRSPRARRLTHEHQRQHQRQIRRRAIIGFGIVVILVVIGLFIAARQQNKAIATNQQSIKTTVSKKQTKQSTSDTATITKSLPAEIAKLESELSLPNETALDSSLEPSGAQVSVTVIDLSDENRGQVHYNDTTQWTSASTYKLFVALEENQRVENGTLSWSSSLNDETLSNCLRQMILVSDNNCPEAWLSTYSSFSKLTARATAIGTSQTAFSVNNMRTSGADLADLLQQLKRGKLMNSSDTQNLLTLMSEQEYRDGIPAGIKTNIANGVTPTSATVSDKVGFIDNYTGPVLNDAAVVNSSNGNYVLVIMTNGYSWQFIANLTSWIDAQME